MPVMDTVFLLNAIVLTFSMSRLRLYSLFKCSRISKTAEIQVQDGIEQVNETCVLKCQT